MSSRLSIWAEAFELCGCCMEWVGLALIVVFGIVLAVCIGIATAFVYFFSLCIVLLSRGVDWSLGRRA